MVKLCEFSNEFVVFLGGGKENGKSGLLSMRQYGAWQHGERGAVGYSVSSQMIGANQLNWSAHSGVNRKTNPWPGRVYLFKMVPDPDPVYWHMFQPFQHLARFFIRRMDYR